MAVGITRLTNDPPKYGASEGLNIGPVSAHCQSHCFDLNLDVRCLQLDSRAKAAAARPSTSMHVELSIFTICNDGRLAGDETKEC